MSNQPPQRIWLQWNDQPENVTWCTNKQINDSDIEYILVDEHWQTVRRLMAEIKEQDKEINAVRKTLADARVTLEWTQDKLRQERGKGQ